MKNICENCGAELETGVKFCQECGNKVNPTENSETVFCPNCGNKLTNKDYFCTECGTNLYAPIKPKEKFMERYRIPITIVAIITIAILAFTLTPLIPDLNSESQFVSVETYDFNIPTSFEYDAEASDEVIDEKIQHKEWTNGDERIEIAVSKLDPKGDVEKVLVNLGGYKEEKYGIKGHHYQFRDGNECFAYAADEGKMISIIVSDAKLFDKIKVL